jgi:copper chaperone CopZ
MKSWNLFIWFFVLFLGACQTSSNSKDAEVTLDDIAATVDATHTAEIELTGMVCEMGCAADIRKALKGTGGVAQVDFDFEKDREINIAMVQFDAETIEAEQLKKAIEQLNDGQFDVTSMETKTYFKDHTKSDTKPSSESANGAKMNQSMISLKDIVVIVAAWFI